MNICLGELLPYLNVIVGEGDEQVDIDRSTDDQLREVLVAVDVLDRWCETVRVEAMRRGWKVEPPDHPDAAQMVATDDAIYEAFRQANAVKFGFWPSGHDAGQSPPPQPESGRDDGDQR